MKRLITILLLMSSCEEKVNICDPAMGVVTEKYYSPPCYHASTVKGKPISMAILVPAPHLNSKTHTPESYNVKFTPDNCNGQSINVQVDAIKYGSINVGERYHFAYLEKHVTH